MPVRRFQQCLSSELAVAMRTALLALLLLGQVWQAVFAQSLDLAAFDELDVDPPLIRHDVVSEAPAAFRQLFSAEVSDDNTLASVTLFWRFEGEDGYSPIEMVQVSESSIWNARVPTSDLESRSIEYYLQASDAGGNRTVRGFAFSPLVRRILGSEPVATEITAGPTVARSRVVYYVLGALAIGLIAGFVSSGEGGSDDPDDEPNECGVDGCEVVITFQSPVVQ